MVTIRILLIIIILILSGCMNHPGCLKHPCVEVPGNTKASPKEQSYAASSLFESADVDRCRNFKVLNTVYQGHKSKFIWTEEWTIDACGKKFKSIVEFGPYGGISHGLWLEEVK